MNFYLKILGFQLFFQIYNSRTIPLEEKSKLLQTETERDKNSDRSVRAKFKCEACIPDKANKKEMWKIFISNKTESLHNMASAMNGFTSRGQLDLTEEYLTQHFFTDVVTVAKNNEHFYLENFISACGPRYFVNEDMISRLEKLAEEQKSIDTLNRKIKEMSDDMRRFLKAHKLCEQYLSNLK